MKCNQITGWKGKNSPMRKKCNNNIRRQRFHRIVGLVIIFTLMSVWYYDEFAFFPFFRCCLSLFLLRFWSGNWPNNVLWILLLFSFFHGQWKRLSTVGKFENWVCFQCNINFCCWCVVILWTCFRFIKMLFRIHINWCLSIKCI